MAFPQEWMDELLSKNEITEVISSYVALKPKGRKLWACCPLHGEKTPSFSVFHHCLGDGDHRQPCPRVVGVSVDRIDDINASRRDPDSQASDSPVHFPEETSGKK